MTYLEPPSDLGLVQSLVEKLYSLQPTSLQSIEISLHTSGIAHTSFEPSQRVLVALYYAEVNNILDVSLDELAGRKEGNGAATIHNAELHRLYKKVDQLSDEDQKALVILLDSLVKRSRIGRVMAEA